MVAATRTLVRPAQFEAGNLIDWISDQKAFTTFDKKETTLTLTKSDKDAPRRVTMDPKTRTMPFK